MAPKTAQAKAHSAHQLRDSRGHFISSQREISSLIKSSGATLSSKIESPITNLIPEFEKPIVAVSINNPFRKILYWLDQIRRHQTTTVALNSPYR